MALPTIPWAPAAQAGGSALAPPVNFVKNAFCVANVVYIPVDEVFMHYFDKMFSASGRLASLPPGFGSYWGTLILQTPSLPTPGKILRAPMHLNCITFCRGGGQKLDRKREDNCTSFWLRHSTNYQPTLTFHSLTGGSNIFKFGLSKGVVSNQRKDRPSTHFTGNYRTCRHFLEVC